MVELGRDAGAAVDARPDIPDDGDPLEALGATAPPAPAVASPATKSTEMAWDGAPVPVPDRAAPGVEAGNAWADADLGRIGSWGTSAGALADMGVGGASVAGVAGAVPTLLCSAT